MGSFKFLPLAATINKSDNSVTEHKRNLFLAFNQSPVDVGVKKAII